MKCLYLFQFMPVLLLRCLIIHMDILQLKVDKISIFILFRSIKKIWWVFYFIIWLTFSIIICYNMAYIEK